MLSALSVAEVTWMQRFRGYMESVWMLESGLLGGNIWLIRAVWGHELGLF
jgi:hypothetical protein